MAWKQTEQRRQKESIAWEARPLTELLRLAWPIAVSMLSYAVMTLVDTLFVGRLGSAALAGVGLGATASFTLLCFGFGLLRAVKVLVSQARGAGRDEAAAYTGAGLYWAVVLGLLGAGLAFLVAEVLPQVASTAASGEAAADYHRIRMLGAPLLLVYVALREAHYGMGDSRGPMVAVVVANIVNVVLDGSLIFGLDLGVAGAAWASAAAAVVEAAVLLGLRGRRSLGLRSATWMHVRAVAKVGLPTGTQFLLEVGAFAILAAMLAAMGENEMAAHQIALQVIHFGFLPAVAISEAASVMAGEAVGARRDRLVPQLSKLGLGIIGIYATLFTLVLVFFASSIATAFTEDAALIETATALLYLAALFQCADAAQIIARGVLRGVGDVRYSAVVGIAASWITTPPLTWYLGDYLGLGAVGGWLALTAEITVATVVLWRRLIRGGWRDAADRTRAEMERASRASLVPEAAK